MEIIACARSNRHAFFFIGSKTFDCGVDGVLSGRQRIEVKEAGRVAGGGERLAVAGKSNRRTRNNRSCGVGNGAMQAAGSILSQKRGGEN